MPRLLSSRSTLLQQQRQVTQVEAYQHYSTATVQHIDIMKLSLPLLVPALACLAQADSGNLYIYDSDLQAASPASTTVSPETARLIIASRLGLDQFHDIGDASEKTIQAINQLSADQNLFTTSAEKSVALILGQAVNQKGMPPIDNIMVNIPF